jgi:CPA2 family monovalent cation:H+ antiporter-2
VSHQAAADALPIRDAFAVLFFVSVGMLLDPSFLFTNPLLVAAGLGIVLVAKPLAALAIVAALGYPVRTALTVAIGLAQIGEFSFILAQVATQHELLPKEGLDVLVASAIVSITLNPLVFRMIDPIEAALRRRPRLWRMLNARSERRAAALNAAAAPGITAATKPLAMIVGYGPVGRVVDALLRDAGFHTVILEMNLDTVESLTRAGHSAIYGDATNAQVLDEAGVRRAVHLVVTLPHSSSRAPLVRAARELNPDVQITVRARYLGEREVLKAAGANKVIFEEGEAGIALARTVMEHRGLDKPIVDKMLDALRRIWRIDE